MPKQQMSKRSRALHSQSHTSAFRGPDPRNQEAGYLSRAVTEESSEILNRATRGLKLGGRSVRMADYYTMSMVYPDRLQRLRTRSRFDHPLSHRAIVKKLADLSLPSLEQPLSARIVGVGRFGKSVGIEVMYPEYEEEARALNSEVKRLLGYSASYAGGVCPVEPHVSIIRGEVRGQSNLNHIKGLLPDVIQLSAAQWPED